MSRKQLLEAMDSNEISEWMAFHNLEPFGDEWRQTALLAMWEALHATQGKQKFKIEEFMPVVKRYDPEKDKQAFKKLDAIAKMHKELARLKQEKAKPHQE